MADPTTLLELAGARHQAAVAAQAAAVQALAGGQQALDNARKAHASAVEHLAGLAADAAAIRLALGAVETKADGDALLAKLEQTTIDLRAAGIAALDRDRDEKLARQALDRAQTAKQDASAAVAAAQAALADAGARSARIGKWTALLAKEPLKSLRAEAGAALNTAPKNKTYLAAKTRLEGELPAALLARALERRASRVAAADAATTAYDAVTALSPGGAAAAVARAEMNLSDYAGSAKGRFDAALKLLAGVAASTNSPLTAAQKQRINDAVLVQKASAAAAREKDVDDTASKLAAKQAALDLAAVKALAADVDADPAADADVQAATTERDHAKDDFDAAAAAFTPDMRKDLHAWAAAVPDSEWRLLDDFAGASATLNQLKDTDPAPLETALGDAEKALAGAQWKDGKSRRRDQYLAVQLAQAAAAADQEKGAVAARALAALRGDR